MAGMEAEAMKLEWGKLILLSLLLGISMAAAVMAAMTGFLIAVPVFFVAMGILVWKVTQAAADIPVPDGDATEQRKR
jgi:hypothetical protein